MPAVLQINKSEKSLVDLLSAGSWNVFVVLFFLVNIPLTVFSANKTWSGATSTAWAVASNWVGNSLPGNGDNVLIPGGLTNYPVASANVTTKLVTVNSTGTGGRLTITGGTFKSGQITVNASGLLIVSAGTMTVAGIVVNGTFNATGGSVMSSNLLLVNNGGQVNQTAGLIHLNSNTSLSPKDHLQVNTGGVFNQSGGTLFFKDLLPGGGTFNQTGTTALVKVARNWQMGAGSIFNATAGTVQFTGNGIQSDFAAGTRQFSNVIVDAAVNPGFSNVASGIVAVSGNFTNNNTALSNTINATFIFNGSGNQSVYSATTGTVATFGNFRVDKSGGVLSLLTNCNVAGNTTILNGTLNLATFTSNRSAAGGILTVSAGCSLLLGGTTGGQAGSNFPLNFTAVNLVPGSTVVYNGADQTIALFNYANLTLSGSGGAVVKTLPAAALTVSGNLNVLAGSSTVVTCNASADVNIMGNFSTGVNTVFSGNIYTHTLAGSFINNGTYNSTGITIIGGAISGNGIFNAADATLELNGFSVQTIPAGMFAGDILKNLTVNNPSGVLLTGNLSLTAIVKVLQGDFNTGGFLTLVSTAAQTALIDGSGNGSVSGNVTMQRFVPSGFGYKYVSSPFQSATVNEFSDDLDLLAAFPPFYSYNESSAASGWVNYSSQSGVLQPLAGYAANFGNSATAVTIDITGEVNSTPQVVSLFNTNQPFTTGFNLVGNPYPSPVNWDAAAGWNRVNIDNAIYYFDASGADQYGGTYSSYINGISSNGTAGSLIPAMQGFFVHVSDGAYPVAATLGIDNAARTTDLQPAFHRSSQNETLALIRIDAGFSDAGTAADALVVYFDDSATSGFDKDKDALKIMNTDAGVPSIYSFASGISRLSINAAPLTPESEFVIPLGIQTQKDGKVVFRNKAIELLPDSIHVYLTDAEKRINLDLRLNPEYSVELQKGNYDSRFSLVITTDALPYITDTDEFGVYSSGGQLFIYVNPEDGGESHLVISNMQGQVLYREQFSSEGYHVLTPGFKDGIYVVSFYTVKSSFSKKIFLKDE